MLKELFDNERKNIDFFFNHFDVNTIEPIINLIKNSKGAVIICGVGKSGLVAEKIAMTLASIGIRALHLSPSNAMHGDIGIAQAEDIFIMISSSGESEELIHLVPFMRNRGVHIVAIVNRPNSRLEKASHICIVLPMEKELCPFNLVPTTSSIVQMIFGDILAVGLMQANALTTTEYALNHPSGKIGRRLTLRVKDLMVTGKDLPLFSPEIHVIDTLVELSNKRCGCLLIVDGNNQLLGIFTDGDLRRTLLKNTSNGLNLPMKAVMTKNPRFIDQNEMASAALNLMEADQNCPITVLPVLNENHTLVGLIKLHDIIQSGL